MTTPDCEHKLGRPMERFRRVKSPRKVFAALAAHHRSPWLAAMYRGIYLSGIYFLPLVLSFVPPASA